MAQLAQITTTPLQIQATASWTQASSSGINLLGLTDSTFCILNLWRCKLVLFHYYFAEVSRRTRTSVYKSFIHPLSLEHLLRWYVLVSSWLGFSGIFFSILQLDTVADSPMSALWLCIYRVNIAAYPYFSGHPEWNLKCISIYCLLHNATLSFVQ